MFCSGCWLVVGVCSTCFYDGSQSVLALLKGRQTGVSVGDGQFDNAIGDDRLQLFDAALEVSMGKQTCGGLLRAAPAISCKNIGFGSVLTAGDELSKTLMTCVGQNRHHTPALHTASRPPPSRCRRFVRSMQLASSGSLQDKSKFPGKPFLWSGLRGVWGMT